MILNFNNTNEGELLAYIKCFELNPNWITDSEDISHYHDALEVLWKILVENKDYGWMRSWIYHRIRYFEQCSSPSIYNLKVYLRQQKEAKELCKYMCP